jgi:hypothetical protein
MFNLLQLMYYTLRKIGSQILNRLILFNKYISYAFIPTTCLHFNDSRYETIKSIEVRIALRYITAANRYTCEIAPSKYRPNQFVREELENYSPKAVPLLYYVLILFKK